ELNHGNAAKALEVLKVADSYDHARADVLLLRGRAYLANHQPQPAAEEFQKVIKLRPAAAGAGAVAPAPWIAQLDLARAYAAQGDPGKARAAYQDFLGLWKDADPDVPLLKEAKAELEKLK